MYSIWKYLYDYVSGKGANDRFDNSIENLIYEKNEEMLRKMIGKKVELKSRII